MNGYPRQSRGGVCRRAWLAVAPGAALVPLALVLLAPAPAAAGELRVVVEATAGLRDDGNYFQVEEPPAAPPSAPAAPEDPAAPAAPQGELEELDAQVALAGLRTSLSYVMPRSALALVYAPTWERNLDQDDIDDELAHRLDLGFTMEASRLSRLALRERLLYSPNLDLTPAFQDGIAVVTPRGDQLRHDFDLEVDTRMTRRWSLLFDASHTYREYEDPELFDTWSAGSTVGLEHSLDPRRSWGFGAGYQRYDFEGRSDDVASVYGTFSAELARSTWLDLTVGAYQVEETRQPDPGPVPLPVPGAPLPQVEEVTEERQGFQGGLELNGTRELFSWYVGLGQDTDPGYAIGRTLESARVRAGLSVPFGRRVTFGLNGNGQDNRGLEEGSPEVNRVITGVASLDWRFTDWGRVLGSYSRVWQESEVETLSDLDYDRFTVGFALRLYATGEPPLEPGKEGEARDDDPDVP